MDFRSNQIFFNLNIDVAMKIYDKNNMIVANILFRSICFVCLFEKKNIQTNSDWKKAFRRIPNIFGFNFFFFIQ